MRKVEEVAQISRFGVVGIISMLCHGVSLAFWIEIIGFSPVVSNSIAFLTAFSISYLGHYNWTFSSDSDHATSLPRFFVIAASGFLINGIIMDVATNKYDLHYSWGFLIIVITIPLLTYFVSRLWVFGDRF